MTKNGVFNFTDWVSLQKSSFQKIVGDLTFPDLSCESITICMIGNLENSKVNWLTATVWMALFTIIIDFTIEPIQVPTFGSILCSTS
jgi:hypothetical protein